MNAGLSELLEERSTLVCCGPGGAGKTTVAAALALEGARRGRRAVVVTVDPARRLADALGLDSLSDDPRRIEGLDVDGELWAAMLDPRSTFDGLVRRYAGRPEQAEAILANRFYRNIAGALSGTQEYMAMEKLFHLHDQDRFDLIVVDTPPTRNALDFVEAPGRLIRFLDNPVLRLLMVPARTSLRAATFATQTLLRAVSRVVGTDVVGEAVGFLQAFEGMENGFRQRAARVRSLLAEKATAFVLVSAAQPRPADEVRALAETLGRAGLAVGALVVNRVHPAVAAEVVGVESLRASAAAVTGELRNLYVNLADLLEVSEQERSLVQPLRDLVAPAPTVCIPMLQSDVHDLGGLLEVAGYVVAD